MPARGGSLYCGSSQRSPRAGLPLAAAEHTVAEEHSIPAWQKCLLTYCPASNPPSTRPIEISGAMPSEQKKLGDHRKGQSHDRSDYADRA
jgi:hypothetical protein